MGESRPPRRRRRAGPRVRDPNRRLWTRVFAATGAVRAGSLDAHDERRARHLGARTESALRERAFGCAQGAQTPRRRARGGDEHAEALGAQAVDTGQDAIVAMEALF